MPVPIIDARPAIALPRAPEAIQPYSFPLLAFLAPVAGALAIWAITRSPFTLAFAALGPIIALASFADARVQARRRSRREGVRFRRQLSECAVGIDEWHAAERATLLLATPGASEVLARPGDPERWRRDPTAGIVVNLGRGTVSSTLRLEGSLRHDDDEANAAFAALREHASALLGAPIVADARLGIGICGPAPLANALARGILLQLAGLISPANGALSVPDGRQWEWLGGLPHPRSPPSSSGVRWFAGSHAVIVAVADSAELLPSDCRIVLRVGGGRMVDFLRNANHEAGHFFEAEFVSAEEAIRGAELLSAAAIERGLVTPERGMAEGRDFADLPEAGGRPGSLACAFAWRGAEAFTVDLVQDGPHAVIGGTTGSGKSELLVSWVLAMAASAGPARVNFLLVDFKGGSSFGPIAGLPHVVGLITDLDERSARRAMLSLRAELRFRERLLRDAAARSIDDLPPDGGLPRLVLVVDEFAAMVSDFPELHELFADLAARGRSLGIHLILCTQRPAGVVRDAVLANAALRISLRVNNRADSVAVIDSADAAELPADSPGRALVSLAGGAAQPVQIARATTGDVERVADRWRSEGGTVRRPWCEELPRIVRLDDLPPLASGIPIGLLDLPELQRQETAAYDPAVDGNLLVVGGQRSGKTGLIATLRRAGQAVTLPREIDGAWDVLADTVDRVRQAVPGPSLLLVDDLDALVARFGEEYRVPFVDLLLELMRDGASVGLHVVVTVRRLPAAIQAIAGLSDARLVLRLPNRQEHLLAGGEPGGHVEDSAPGAGEWRGSRVQLALTEPPPIERATPVPRLDLHGRRGLLVVSKRPAVLARRLRESTEADVAELGSTTRAPELWTAEATRPALVVADPETWQTHWALLASLRATVGILFDGCSPAEFRAVSGQRRLPPPLAPHSGAQWLLEPDGGVGRARLA